MRVSVDIGSIVLKTPRLTLRAFSKDDLEDFYDYAKEPGLGESAGWFHHESIEDSKKILDNFIENSRTFAIEFKDKVIGSIGLEDYDQEFLSAYKDEKMIELGFVIGKDYQGKGLMTEALEEVIKFLFDQIGIDIIVAGHFRGNFKSKKLQMKLGFKYYSSHLVNTQMKTTELVHVNLLRKDDFATYLEKKREKLEKDKEIKKQKQIIRRFELKKGEDFTYDLNFSNMLIFVSSGLISYANNIYIGSDLLVITNKNKVRLKILRDSSLILVENNF